MQQRGSSNEPEQLWIRSRTCSSNNPPELLPRSLQIQVHPPEVATPAHKNSCTSLRRLPTPTIPHLQSFKRKQPLPFRIAPESHQRRLLKHKTPPDLPNCRRWHTSKPPRRCLLAATPTSLTERQPHSLQAEGDEPPRSHSSEHNRPPRSHEELHEYPHADPVPPPPTPLYRLTPNNRLSPNSKLQQLSTALPCRPLELVP